MIRLFLAPKSMKGIEEKLIQLTDEKSGKYSKHHEKEKQSIQLRDEIHTQRSAILIESNVYKM
jgi:hypothetical protein